MSVFSEVPGLQLAGGGARERRSQVQEVPSDSLQATYRAPGKGICRVPQPARHWSQRTACGLQDSDGIFFGRGSHHDYLHCGTGRDPRLLW